MTHIKSAALTAVGMIVALAALGFFASVGLALIGGLFVVGAVAALTAWVGTLFAPKPAVASATA